MTTTSAPKRPLLILDADSPSVRLLEATLAHEAYEIEAARSGSEALDKIKNRVPAILLLELTLPDMSGIDLITALKADPTTRDIMIVVVTSKNGHGTEAEVLRAGAAAYVRKPIDPIAFPALLGSKPD